MLTRGPGLIRPVSRRLSRLFGALAILALLAQATPPTVAASSVARGGPFGPVHKVADNVCGLTPAVFNQTVYGYWAEGWGVAVLQEAHFPRGDWELAIEALSTAIGNIEGTSACNASGYQYKEDLIQSLSWHIAYAGCRSEAQDAYLTGDWSIGAVALATACIAWPLNRMQYWYAKSTRDGGEQGPCDPNYTEPDPQPLPGLIYANGAGIALKVISVAGTLKDIHEDPLGGTAKYDAGEAAKVMAQPSSGADGGGGGGAGGCILVNPGSKLAGAIGGEEAVRDTGVSGQVVSSYDAAATGVIDVRIVAHTSSGDLTMFYGSATNADFTSSTDLVVQPNWANLSTLAAAQRSVHVSVVLTYTLYGQAPVSAEFPDSAGTNSAFVWPYAMGSTYTPLSSMTLADTTSADPTINLGGSLTANNTRAFQVAGAAVGGVTLPASVTAVTGNLTVKNASAAGSLAVATSDGTPSVSTLSFPAGDTRTVGLTAEVDSNGRLWIDYLATSGAKADFVFDITGYYTESRQNLRYTGMTAGRLIDTRSSNPATNLGGRLAANSSKSFQLAGKAIGYTTIPVNAAAVTGYLTVVNPSAGGYVSLTDTSAAPAVQALDFPANDTRTVMVNAKLDSTGELWVYYGAAAGSTTDFTFDVTGYYVSGSGGYYYPIPSTRIFDTRSTGKLKANSPALVKASGLAGVPAFGAAGSPTGVVGNLTVTGPSAAGQMGVTNLTSAPTITTVSFPSGDARAGEACSLLWISGVWLGYVAPSGATTDATFDLAGFFSAASSY